MKLKNYIIAILIILISVVTTYAYVEVSQDFDTSLVQGIEYTHQEPRKILFTQIEGRHDTLDLSTEEYLDAVYYYSITKLKLGNIPYHYIIDESGNVYKTQNYNTTRITDEVYIVVGYLSNNGQLGNKAAEAILDLTEDISYSYGLEEYDIKEYSLVETENSFSELTLAQPNNLFSESINNVLEDWEGYSREHLEYRANIETVEYDEEVEVGKKLGVTITVKNSNDFVWTSGKSPIYVSVKDSEESIFAVNEVWDSFSKPTHIESDVYVLPGEVAKLQFDIDPKVTPGEHTETFELLKFDGEPFEDSEFIVNFKVNKGDQRLVQINSPEAGYVNIRDCRRFSCNQVEVVNHEEVYPVIEYHESCWYKIRFAEGKEGWFYCPYAREIE